jgi:hypothetical protein
MSLWDCRGYVAAVSAESNTPYTGALTYTDLSRIKAALEEALTILTDGDTARYKNLLSTGILINDTEHETFARVETTRQGPVAHATWLKGTFHRTFQDTSVPVRGFPDVAQSLFEGMSLSEIQARMNSTMSDSVTFQTPDTTMQPKTVSIPSWNKCHYLQIRMAEILGGEDR